MMMILTPVHGKDPDCLSEGSVVPHPVQKEAGSELTQPSEQPGHLHPLCHGEWIENCQNSKWTKTGTQNVIIIINIEVHFKNCVWNYYLKYVNCSF